MARSSKSIGSATQPALDQTQPSAAPSSAQQGGENYEAQDLLLLHYLISMFPEEAQAIMSQLSGPAEQQQMSAQPGGQNRVQQNLKGGGTNSMSGSTETQGDNF